MVEDQVDRFFEVLADPTRRQVVRLLGEGPRRAGQLASATGASAPAMSRHLRILLTAGLVADERVPDDARVRVFRLNPAPVVAVQAWLDQVQAHWREQLGSFKRHAEQQDSLKRRVERRDSSERQVEHTDPAERHLEQRDSPERRVQDTEPLERQVGRTDSLERHVEEELS